MSKTTQNFLTSAKKPEHLTKRLKYPSAAQKTKNSGEKKQKKLVNRPQATK